MSVIVKGMEMPGCCIDCPIYNGEYCVCNLLPDSHSYNDDGEEHYDPFEKREKDCPLEPYKENDIQLTTQPSYLHSTTIELFKTMISAGISFEELVRHFEIPEDQVDIIKKLLGE